MSIVNGEMKCYVVIVPLILSLLLLLPAGKPVLASDGHVASLADVTVHSTLKELNDFRPGYIYLAVENKSDTLLNVDRIEIAEYPDFIKVKKSSLDTAVVSRKKPVLVYPDKDTINAGESEIYEVFIEASNQLKRTCPRSLDHFLLAKFRLLNQKFFRCQRSQ